MVRWSPELPMSQGCRGPQGRLPRKGGSSLNERANSRCPEAWAATSCPSPPREPSSSPSSPGVPWFPRCPVQGSGLGPVCLQTPPWGPPAPTGMAHPLPPRTSREGLLLAASPPAPLGSRQGGQPVLPSVFLKTSVFRPGNNFTIKKKKKIPNKGQEDWQEGEVFPGAH